jgi:Holliday junction DNA helicase RuvA
VISRIEGTLVAREIDRVEVLTGGGVAYELAVPLGTFEALPHVGDRVALFTYLVVRDDEWLFYGFAQALERRVFRRILAAKGVGPALALGMLSALTAERLVRAIREKDVATLQQVPRVGRKKAEQLILDLADKVDDLAGVSTIAGAPRTPESAAAEDAVRALVSLGYTPVLAEKAVRAALDGGPAERSAPELIRSALLELRR